MAIGKDKTNPYFVRIVVDKTTKEVSEISTYGLYAIKAKKEGAHFMPEGNEAVGDENRLSPYLRSKVSLAQVLEDVKGISIANEVFSEDVAKRLGVRRAKGSLSSARRPLDPTCASSSYQTCRGECGIPVLDPKAYTHTPRARERG